MSKITLSEPSGNYKSIVDTGVMNVVAEEVYTGLYFVTEDKENLAVAMRDSGYELSYDTPNTMGPTVNVELKGGDVYVNGKRVFFGETSEGTFCICRWVVVLIDEPPGRQAVIELNPECLVHKGYRKLEDGDI